MSSRSRRGVKFPHKQAANIAVEGRRASFSEHSEEGSPSKSRSIASLDGIQEEVGEILRALATESMLPLAEKGL